MTSIGVLSTSYTLPNMARVDDGPHPSRPASGFPAVLKEKADPEPLQARPEEMHAQMMQAAVMPRRPDVDAMLLQLFASRKMVLSVAARSGRATVEDCMLADVDGIEDTGVIDAACADEDAKALCTAYPQGLPAWHAGHCAHGLAYGFPVECALQSAAMAVAPPAYTIVWAPAEKLWVPMRSPYARSRRRQRSPAQGNISKPEPRDQDEG
jgi:hypothetical protein